ncbi:MAG TPA: DUF3224 domain-containing protein [Candidatus Sulfotelmatobacter sp.]|jgi:hypothetical protein|nr:DUF3224 domain-containing protein [Candidatus Sulfotelmatobacter sp.]
MRLAALILGAVVAPLLLQTQTSPSKETHMHATGPFDVKMIPQDDKLGDGITRMLLDKHYHGDLEGAAKGQMLTTGISASKSGAYIAMETFTGTLQGKTGGFALHHTGIMRNGTPDLTINVVPDSGTGQLTGITGKMTIIIAADGKHSYDFEYTLNTN